MNRALAARLVKLESKAPPPASPFDAMNRDELMVYLLEECRDIINCPETPAEMRAEAQEYLRRSSRWQNAGNNRLALL